jgi:mono/diheme cytochrome c family protein
VPAHKGNPVNGQLLFNAGGCLSCHKPGPDLKDADASLPAGGFPFKTPIGTLYPPNLTPDPETGIGKWSDLDFLNALQRGLTPDGSHLIPAFPYTSYARMAPEDVLDIKAYLFTLKHVSSPWRAPDIPIPIVLRRGIGLWKWIGLDTDPWKPDPSQSARWNRGSYLVNGPGHCGECHTPRNLFMVSDQSRFMAGGPHPDGSTSKVPSLRDLVGRKRYKDAADLVSAMQFGEVMGYDKISSGGMGEVQTNLSKLPPADLNAIAEYLVSLK